MVRDMWSRIKDQRLKRFWCWKEARLLRVRVLDLGVWECCAVWPCMGRRGVLFCEVSFRFWSYTLFHDFGQELESESDSD